MNPKRITYNTHVGNTANGFGGGNLLCTHAPHKANGSPANINYRLHTSRLSAIMMPTAFIRENSLVLVNALIIAQYFHT